VLSAYACAANAFEEQHRRIMQAAGVALVSAFGGSIPRAAELRRVS
jgi:hypothetical protein